MEYRVLGRTGLLVSRIGFGVYSLTGLYGEVSEEQALELLNYAEKIGINFYDTADVYAKGYGEELLCNAFGERGMQRIIVATKIGYDFYSGSYPPPRRYSSEYLVWAAEKSSERLCKTPIDLVQIHNPPLEALRGWELWKAVERVLDEGLAKHVGIALGPETDVLEHALIALNHSEVEALQFVYNMLEQEPGATIARIASAKNIGTLVRVPHAGGILDETIKPSEAARLRDHRSLRRRGWYEWGFKVYAEMRRILANIPGTAGQKAIRFILDSISADSIVVIAKTQTRLKEYVDSLRLPSLSKDLVRIIRSIYNKYIEENPEKPFRSLRVIYK